MTEQQLAWKGAKAFLHRHGGAKLKTLSGPEKLFSCVGPPRASGASMTEQQLAWEGAKALLHSLSSDLEGPKFKNAFGMEHFFRRKRAQSYYDACLSAAESCVW